MREMRSARWRGPRPCPPSAFRSAKLVFFRRLMPRLEAEDERWLERRLPAELPVIAQRAGRHRSHLLYRVDVDEDRDSIAHHQPREHAVSIGRVAAGVRGPGDRALYAAAAGALDPPLSD